MTPPETRPATPLLTRADVLAAAARTAGHVRRTPVTEVVLETPTGPLAVWLKLEQLQHTGSFKARGAANRLLAAAQEGALPAAGVVAASGGNAGLAVAHTARALGVPATVVVPTTAPAGKVARLAALGATVVARGGEYAEAYLAAQELVAGTGALFCHAYDQLEVCAGQGTVGLEIAEQVPGVTTVLVAVGGGGLAAGVAAALAGTARVVGVEPSSIPTWHAARAAGTPVDVAVGGVAADSLGARRLGAIAFDTLTRCRADALLVPDDAVVAARAHLWAEHRLVVEHGGAVALAALRTGAHVPAPAETVVVLLCGANTDPATLG